MSVTLEGLSGEQEKAARASLTLQQYVGRDVTEAQVQQFYADGENEIRPALEPFGYYNARVDAQLQTVRDGFNAVYHITPGPQVVVRAVNVQVTGEGREFPTVREAVQHFKPAVGEPLDQALYDRSKGAVESALSGAGYLRAQQSAHEIRVSRSTNSGTIHVVWQSGPRYRFGKVRFSKAQFPENSPWRYVPWKEGDYYSLERLLAFQQQLVNADYFSTVGVQPNLAQAEGDRVPIDVSLRPAKRNVYTAGAYVSTDTGPGARAGVERRWVNSAGHKAQASVDYAQRLQQYLLAYRVPRPGPDSRSWNFGASYIDANTVTFTSRSDRVGASEVREWHGFSRSLGLQYLNSRFQIAGEWGRAGLFFAEGVLSKRRVDDPGFPHHGHSLTVTARFAPGGPLSDTGFAWLETDLKWVLSLGAHERVLLRTTLGAMSVRNFSLLPPELRFFAGGDVSVRGFSYQQIGERNATGGVIGGELLTVASAEYQHYFLPNWGAAVFVDGGDAFFRRQFRLNVGAGIGARWRSPLGLLRLDIGYPVDSPFKHKIRLHIQVGPDL